MSAKINVETDDPALAAALGMLVAKAIKDAGFANAMAKNVTVKTTVTIGSEKSFGRVGELVLHLEPENVELNGVRQPPTLAPIHWMVPPEDVDFIQRIEGNHPGTLNKLLVLSFYPDTNEAYEQAVAAFLAGAFQS